MTTLDLFGLRPDQIRELTKMRDNMRGWEFMGCAVDIDGDYFWRCGDRTLDLEKAELFADARAAQREIDAVIRDGADDDRVLTVVGVYRNGSEWDTGPSDPGAA